ncbi:MAG: penicillin-binding protein 1B [bacterium]
MALGIIVGVPYVSYLDSRVTEKFEGKRWELPARVYSRSLDLYAGRSIDAQSLESELKWLHYLKVKTPKRPGEYSRSSSAIALVARGFDFPDERTVARHLKLKFSGSSIASISDTKTGSPVDLHRLDPVLVANIYPRHHEDRVLIKLDQVPEFMVQALLAVEDKNFYQHHGVRPSSIARAMIANVRAGRMVQGGSTLTQQLVKNLFLSNERKLSRKVNEAIMSLLLEWHYDKDEILEAYLNEIYLGQDGERAIHGFGLASRFYFQRDLTDLQPEQMALLVAIVKGASWFDPRRHPKRVMQRRNIVLDSLANEGLLSEEEAAKYKARPLGVTGRIPSGVTAFPAFLELVKEQLRRDYREEDLNSEGLRVFTTLDPQVQMRTETAIRRQLQRMENDRGIKPDTLQAAMTVASVDQGEVLAMVGGRRVRFSGFNRVLDMKRQIGSLVKPAVYLTALADPGHYNLATPLDDSPLEVEQYDGTLWSPKNYDNEDHGQVMLIDALTHSYNVSTARLGLTLGLDKVIHTLRALGVEQEVKAYPSLLLGAVELSPYEVLQMYQVIAANGYRSTLRAILSVINPQGETLQRYPLTVQQVIPPEADYLLLTALKEVAKKGTAKSLSWLLPEGLEVAGKTGTTNDLRDSWFAGFSGDHVGVAWVGRDDNQSTGLTGSSGALRVWADTFKTLDTTSLSPIEPDAVEWYQVDREQGLVWAEPCGSDDWLPFLPGSIEHQLTPCASSSLAPMQPSETGGSKSIPVPANKEKSPVNSGLEWLKGFF